MKSTQFNAPTLLAAGAALLASSAKAQSFQDHNLTPDGYWHNRYHALLSMAAYGDYETTCPTQTFTEENKLRNFPDSTRAPWTLINKFGPTPSGCEGFTAIIPEMNKALIIFKGNYALEKAMPLETVEWSESTTGNGNETALPARCDGCTVNAFALQGYMECRAETNNWQEIRDNYAGQDLVFSITGHGLGGAHSQLASIDLYEQEVDYYSHAYASPRIFNALGSQWYMDRFNGEAGERGVANNDQMGEVIPESENYTHTGTPFYYYGFNSSSLAMNMQICWVEDEGVAAYSNCGPKEQGTGTPDQDHYFYFAPVTDCGGENQPDLALQDQFLAGVTGQTTSAEVTLGSTSTSSSSTPAPTQPAPTSDAAPAPEGTSESDQGSGASPLATFSLASLLGMAALVSSL